MRNADAPATSIQFKQPDMYGGDDIAQYKGLTKREHFAGLAMQTLISDSSLSPSEASKLAIDYADALLAELDK